MTTSTPRRAAHARTAEQGFTVVEMTVALAVFALLSVLFASQLVGNYRVYGRAKERTSAEEIATRLIEQTRELDYADIGIVGGSPPGTIPATQTQVVNGVSFIVTSTVALVDDPVPGGLNTTGNYKRLRVVVTSGGVVLSDLVTVVASPQKATATNSLMRIMVADYAVTRPIVGATVTVSGGPSPTQAALTDGAGRVSFSGLLPTDAAKPHYTIAAASAGYRVYPDDVPNSPAVYTTFAPQQVFDTTIRLFRTVSVKFKLINPDGTPFLEPTWLWFRSDRGGTWISVADGTVLDTLTLSTGVVEPVLPNLRYSAWGAQSFPPGRQFYGNSVDQIVPPAYPSNLQSVFTITMTEYIPPTTSSTVAATTTTAAGPPVTGSSPPTTAPSPTTTTSSSSTTTTTQPITGM